MKSDARLQNQKPVDFRCEEFISLCKKLQGNILKGHGRDYSVNIFLEFRVRNDDLRYVLSDLAAEYVTSAFQQLEQTEQFRSFGIPGAMFGNLLLTKRSYLKLGLDHRQLEKCFSDPPEQSNPAFPQKANFIDGMKAAADDFGDRVGATEFLEPLEKAYQDEKIDALLLLADDSKELLLRKAREIIDRLHSKSVATVLAVEIGESLRTDEGEGIEHFGYVDGRSQPLFLKSDFQGLTKDGSVDPATTTEKVNDKAIRRESGDIRFWNPFASLAVALTRDLAVDDADSFGSYFVFRKLEQDVLRFSMAEQNLADALHLEGDDRERAGAMTVGRFRDGTPLTLKDADGAVPAKSNDFRYDGLDSSLQPVAGAPKDRLGLRCPFQAHIRKTNPRQAVNKNNANSEEIANAESADRGRRIVRRGIPYGTRKKHPNVFQALDDLPSKDVGLLFACFQSSITRQFGFMQKTWANNGQFKVPLRANPQLASTGRDPLIGQPIQGGTPSPQNWRKLYDGDLGQPDPTDLSQLSLELSHPTPSDFGGFIKFRGGEFFFAPSLTFLLRGATNAEG